MSEPKRRQGRPTRCTPPLIKRIAANVALSMSLKYSAEAEGVHETVAHDWMFKGEAGVEPYDAFYLAITRARADAVRTLTQKALEGGKGSSLATWFLERRFRGDYAQLQKHEFSGPEGKPIAIEVEDITKLSDDELRRLAANSEPG